LGQVADPGPKTIPVGAQGAELIQHLARDSRNASRYSYPQGAIRSLCQRKHCRRRRCFTQKLNPRETPAVKAGETVLGADPKKPASSLQDCLDKIRWKPVVHGEIGADVVAG
jgi:hypothetical protein